MSFKETLRAVSSGALALMLTMQLVPTAAMAEMADTFDDPAEFEMEDVAEERDELPVSIDEEYDGDDVAAPPEGDSWDSDDIEMLENDEANASEELKSEDDKVQLIEQSVDSEIVSQAINRDISDSQEWDVYARRTTFYEDGSPHSPTGISIGSFQDDAWIELTEGEDFELDYCLDSSGNRVDGAPIGAGEYQAFYKGINDYSGTVGVPFSIVAERSLDEALLSVAKTVYLYTGSPAALMLRVIDAVSYESLVEGRDFSVEYRDANGHKLTGIPEEAGKYSVRAVGMGDYTGSTDPVTFAIIKADNAQGLSFGKNYSGSFTASKQRAAFTFTLPSSGLVRLSGTAPRNTKLLLFGADGVLLLQRESDGDGTVDLSKLTVFGPSGGSPLNAGIYTCLIGLGAGAEGEEAPLGDYALSMSFTSANESFSESYGGTDNTIDGANAAQFGRKYKGLIALRDTIDFYAFDAQADGTASIELDAYEPWAVAHVYLRIYDEQGNEEWSGYTIWDAEHQQHGFVSQMDHWSFGGIELKSGVHYLKVSNGNDTDWDMQAGYYGAYELEVDFRSSDGSFIDISAITPHAADITWLAASGISTGWSEKDGTKTFRPTNTVIRQDMAAFLFRLAKSWGLVGDDWQPSGTVTFTDVSERTPHYREIMWLAESGVSAGWKVSGGREFRPTNTVVRQDMAAFLRRLQALRDPSVGEWQPAGASPFRDVSSKTPHRDDILWLAESGVSAGWKVSGGKEFRPTNTVIRQDMAAFLHRLDGLG